MSEPTALPEQLPDLGAGRADSPERPGALLRAAREAQGLHIGALAVALKVPVRKLEALEADRLSELPDMVFVRGLASSVCRALNIPDAPILAKLPQHLAPRLDLQDSGLNASYRVKGQRTEASIAGQLFKPLAWLFWYCSLPVCCWYSSPFARFYKARKVPPQCRSKHLAQRR